MRRLLRSSGFTLIEALATIAVLSVVIAATLSSFFYTTRSERRAAALAELDLDARKVTESLRRDLWLTSRDLVLLYPPGPGPYTAIGFPIVYREGADPILPDENGRIPWNATVIYHFWQGTTPEVRRTFFYPLLTQTEAERMEQIARVVQDGDARNDPHSANARTRVMARNLIEWWLNVSSPIFDGYSETPGRKTASFGSVLLTPGLHEFTFKVVGRNSRSSGRRGGIDTLTVTPSAATFEAEAYLPPLRRQGPLPYAEYQLDGTWSGNYRVIWPAGNDGDEITFQMENDRWEERNFLNTGALFEDTEAIFDTSRNPHEFVVQLVGNGRVWEAALQTRSSGENPSNPIPSDTALRVLLRGNNLADGGWLNFNGTNVWAGFRAHDEILYSLRIRRAFIAEADPASPMNFIPGTEVTLSFGGATNRTVWAAAETDRTAFRVQKDKSYLVSFLVQDWETIPMGWARQWRTPADFAQMPSIYVVTNASIAVLNDPNWSRRSDLIASPHIYGLEYLRAGYAPEGYYTSQIFDTHEENPQYLEFNWRAITPEGTSLTMQIRAGNDPDLSDAPSWNVVPAATAGAVPSISGRYVQVRARLKPSGDGLATPTLRDFIVRWTGSTRIVDLGGVFTTGPDHGQIELWVDGAPLLQGVTVDLTVYKDVSLGRGGKKRFTSSVFAEMSPRNTGK